METHGGEADSQLTTAVPRVSWPPPGLEPLQGVLWPLLRRFALGAALFAFPLLIAIATPQGFASFGPFGRSFWIPAASSLVALIVLFDAAFRLSRALRQAAAAARYGYDHSTIALVAADGPRDTGFILQGARMYSGVSPDTRKSLLFTRTIGPLTYLAAALWLPFGAALAVLLAYVGMIGPRAMWLLTILPAALLALPGWLARAAEATIARRVAKRWKSVAPEQDTIPVEAARWREQLQMVADNAWTSRQPARPGPFKAAAFAVVVPALLLLVPVIAIAAATVMGPLLAALAVPQGMAEDRLRSAQLFRSYALPMDSSITPEQAGRMLVNLMHIGRQETRPLEQPPDRAYSASPMEGTGAYRPVQYRADSIARLLRGRSFTPDDRAELAKTAAHPAHEEFALLARASSVDVAGTRWKLPFPDSITLWSVPIPRFGGLRELAYAHVMLGYQQYLDGHTADAERSMRETISTGFHLIDDGLTLIEALIGRVIVSIGVNGLQAIYQASGQAEAAAVIRTRVAADELMQKARRHIDLFRSIDQLPKAVTDTTLPRSIRWERFATFNIFAPCVNLNRAIFPTNPEYDRWLALARTSLVRFPADTAFFNLARDQALMPRRERIFRCAGPIDFMRSIL